MDTKRKRKVVTLTDKLNALKRLDSGEQLKTISKDYGVGISTVSEWRKNRHQIEKWNSVLTSPAPKRKVMKSSNYDKVDKALYLWFTQQRAGDVPMSGPILQQKAIEISEELPVSEAPLDFKASEGWLSRWKERHGIRQLRICGEKLSADQTVVEGFKTTFKKIIKENSYSPDQLYNCDETGLYYKMVPSKTLASKNEISAPGYKKSKDRVTILACSNYSGRHKMRLMCVGKSAKPRAFKHLKPNVMPLYYRHQKSSWMNSDLFKSWFFDEFVPEVSKFLKIKGLPVKALLLVDNAPSHLSENVLISGDIKVLFLPPNVTSILQPMDQGVLENLKRNYRKYLLQFVLENTNEGANLSECLKNVNLKDVIYWIADAWNNVKDTTIQKSWEKIIEESTKVKKTGHNDEDENLYDQSEDENLYDLARKIPEFKDLTKEELDTWVQVDKLDEQELSNRELIDLTSEKNDTGSEGGESDLEEEENKKITHSEAIDCFEKALIYIEQQPEATATDLFLIRWRNIAVKNLRCKIKQSTLDSFVNSG